MWDRSMLAMSGAERDFQDALLALERVLECRELGDDARKALHAARERLRDELAERERLAAERPLRGWRRGENP